MAEQNRELSVNQLRTARNLVSSVMMNDYDLTFNESSNLYLIAQGLDMTIESLSPEGGVVINEAQSFKFKDVRSRGITSS